MGDAPIDAQIRPARRAIDRGDYGQALALLEPLADQHPVTTPAGARLRMLMVTALMGLGRDAQALATARLLGRCGDPDLRAQARQLVSILEAPALQRPSSWSLRLPDLQAVGSMEGTAPLSRRRPRSPRPPAPPPPPVGPTRAPLGLAITLAVLLLLTALLSGCADVELRMIFPAPGRIRIEERVAASSPGLTPWQERLAADWRRRLDHGRVEDGPRDSGASRELRYRSAVLPIHQGREVLEQSLAALSDRLSSDEPAADWQLEERNWLLGVRQSGRLRLDLRSVPAVPGLQARVQLEPLPLRAVRRVRGTPPERRGGSLVWPLRPGALNELVWVCWRWSPLGLGALVVAGLLALSLTLRHLLLRSGRGFPELPA